MMTCTASISGQSPYNNRDGRFNCQLQAHPRDVPHNNTNYGTWGWDEGTPPLNNLRNLGKSPTNGRLYDERDDRIARLESLLADARRASVTETEAAVLNRGRELWRATLSPNLIGFVTALSELLQAIQADVDAVGDV